MPCLDCSKVNVICDKKDLLQDEGGYVYLKAFVRAWVKYVEADFRVVE